MRRVTLVRRLAWICWELGAALARESGRRLVATVVRRRRRHGRRYAALVDAVERLGPTFIKLAQVASTRTDLLPRDLCRLLGRLYDSVKAPPPAEAAIAVPAALLAAVEHGADGMEPVGAGSVASVYRARLCDGETVAVKVLRPGVRKTMAADLALLAAGARVIGRLRRLRGIPLAELVAQLGTSISQQLDLEREAEAVRVLGRNLRGIDGVRVPQVHQVWSGPDALVLEYVEGLRRDRRDVPAAAERAAMLRALRAAYQMLFLDGFVHCDLHPGNLYPMPDGSVVIVDAGFSVRLSNLVRFKFAEFFLHMGQGNGKRCADIVLSTARRMRPDADAEGFREALANLVNQSTHRSVADFNLASFTIELFSVQRRHGFLADPQFVYPILSLLVLEGAMRERCPDVDFQAEALPYVFRGAMAGADRDRHPGRTISAAGSGWKFGRDSG